MAKGARIGQRGTDITKSRLWWMVGLPSVVLATIAEHYFPGWGRTVLTIAALIGLLAAIWLRFWPFAWFWVFFLPLSIAHCMLVVSFRDVLNKLNIAAWFGLAAIEGLVFAVIVSIPISIAHKRNPDIL